MGKKLFIVGNGFDLQHNISSRYQDLHTFIKERYILHKDPFYLPGGGLLPKQFMYGYQYHDMEYVLAFLDYTLTLTEKTDNWWNIEDSLSKLYLMNEFDLNSDDPFTKIDYNESPENQIFYIGQCFRIFYILFHLWVNQIDISKTTPNHSFQKLIDPEGDYFLTFNYTRTLEDIYHAKNVFHIHGVQGPGVKMFGHQVKDEEYIVSFCEANCIPLSCLEGVKYLFELTEKNTRSIYENNKRYFESLDSEIKEIYSYGFSFSLVDMIYIYGICKSLSTQNIVWFLSDYSSPEQIDEYKRMISASGFKGTFSTFHISDSSPKGIQIKSFLKTITKVFRK